MRREYLLRWAFFLIGLIVLAFGISLTIKGKVLGIGPWDVFHYGLYKQLGLTIGSWSIIVGIIIIVLTWIGTKTPPTVGAIVNMLLLGTFIDLFNGILPNPESVAIQVICFIVGVVILGYGIALYVSANLGAGPRDGLMLLIVEKTGWSITLVRNGIEFTVFFFGWLLGGPVGVGTIFIALFLGKIIHISMPQCQRMLQRMIEKEEADELKRSIM